MANKEQLEILKRGVDAWNQWRRDNSGKEINLSEADLLGVDLIDADFTNADLNSANLNGADLSGANLSNANLRGAKLIGADLQSIIFKDTKYNKATKWPKGFDPKQKKIMADKEQLEILKRGVDAWNKWRIDNSGKEIDLSEADLSGTDLTGGNLSYAKLFCANFKNTDLIGANLNGADFFGANLIDTSLIGADLEGVIFKDTKYNKNTKWPKRFDPKKVEGLILCS